MKIQFAEHEFILHPSGALYWPKENMLVVTDLHLEKGSHFAIKGFFLPPYDSHHTLSLLADVVRETNPARLLLLGDAFHDAKGHARLGRKEQELFNSLLKLKPVWVIGNHDGDFVPDGFSGMTDYMLHGITFRHEAGDHEFFEISGHYHPKVEIARSGKPCFVEDGRRMIMPAFGAYTGGLFLSDPALARHLGPEPRVYALGANKVYSIK